MTTTWVKQAREAGRPRGPLCRSPGPGAVMASALLCLTLLAPGGPRLEAQQGVRGRVTDRATGQAIEGAMVVLLRDDVTVSRVLSASDGSFVLSTREPGMHALRVDRIGYESTVLGSFEIPAGATVEQSLEAGVRAVALRGLDVTGDSRCQVRPADGAVTARAWEEARKALEAARWTSERELYRFAWVRFVRELDSRSRVTSEERTPRRDLTAQPFVSVDPDTLAREGFVRERGGQVLYAAPDASVLLSDAFLDGHCFEAERRREGGRTVVALRFRPVQTARRPDVEGVMVLDAESGVLESVDYRYVNLARPVTVRGEDASGRLRFRALPNGTWVVDEWTIRMPRLVEVRDSDGRPRRFDIRGYVEEGGSISRIVSSQGALQARVGSRIQGTVVDSLGAPLPDARVWVEGAEIETTTAVDGTFRLDVLGTNTWVLRASHPMLSRLGYVGVLAEVNVERDGSQPVRLALPSRSSVVEGRCAASGRDSTGVALVGTVTRADARPASAADVRATWTESRSVSRRQFAGVGVEADSLGVFVLCGLPRSSSVTVSASSAGTDATSTTLDLTKSAAVASIDVTLPVRTQAAEAVAAALSELGQANTEARAWLASTGFELRGAGALLHLSRPQVATMGADSLPQILMLSPRIEVRPWLNGVAEFRLHASEGWATGAGPDTSCELDLYLNGSFVRDRMEESIGLSLSELLRPRDLTGIEAYPGEFAPAGPPDACGAILLWVASARHRDDPDFEGRVTGRVVLTEGDDPTTTTVRLRPGEREAKPDRQGYFSFGTLAPAGYTLEARLPSWGLWSTHLDIRAGSTVDLVIDPADGEPTDATPSMDPDRLRREYCADSPPNAAIVLGRVLEEATGTPVAGATVEIRWEFSPGLFDWSGVPRDFQSRIRMTTGPSGTYLACGLPAPTRVFLSASAGDARAGAASVAAARDTVIVRDIVVR